MSSLTTTSINTANGTTPLTVGTGNTSGPSIVVSSGTDVFIRANTTANVVIANSTALNVNVNTTFTKNLAVSGSMSISNLAITNTLSTPTLSVNIISGTSGNVSVSSNVTFANVRATFVNTTSMSLGNSSIATSGFTTLPNGLLLNWGSSSILTSATTITFTRAFSSTPFSITLGPRSSEDAWVTTSNSSTFTADTDVNQTIYWMAIGPA